MTEFQKYIQRYLDLIPSQNWMEEMAKSEAETLQIYSKLNDETALYKYEEGKWTLKEMLLHIIDTERIFQYRALSFARNETQDLLGFDENLFAENSLANERTLKSLIDEYKANRQSSIILFENFSEKVLAKTGTSSGNRISVKQLGYLIIGHNLHHLNVIRERYQN